MDIRHTGQESETTRSEALVEALEGADPPLAPLRFASIHSVSGHPDDVDEALRGRFRVGRERLSLRPPVDWGDAPFRAGESRAFFQNSLVFADPLLADPRAGETLGLLAALFVDWLAAHAELLEDKAHRFVWHDHAAAGRLVYLSWVLREGIRLDVLDAVQRRALATGVLQHVAFVSADEHYVGAHNHGLFSDAALALAARALAPFPPAREWAALASARFRVVLDGTVNPDDAVHLEHSPYYHWIIQSALGRFADADLFADLGLRELVDRMQEAGAWFTAPDGLLVAFGDTPSGTRASGTARRRAEAQQGAIAFRGAGYAVARDGNSYLAVTAAHHPTAHKHADDGSFVLYEDGRAIVGDSGAAGYEYASVERRYGVSPAAHSGVTVDEFDRLAAERPATGSGLLAMRDGADDGLHVVLVRIPNLALDGGDALRLLLYRPSRWLVVADTLSAAVRGDVVTRRIQLAPDLRAVKDGGTVAILRDDTPVASLRASSGPGREADAVEVVRGRHEPTAAGWTLDADVVLHPRDTIVLLGPGLHPRAFTLVLAGVDGPYVSVAATDEMVSVRLDEDGVVRHVRARAGGVTVVGE